MSTLNLVTINWKRRKIGRVFDDKKKRGQIKSSSYERCNLISEYEKRPNNYTWRIVHLESLWCEILTLPLKLLQYFSAP